MKPSGSSTWVLQTPSPAERKPSSSLNSNQLANITNTAKSVTFSPAQTNQSSYFNPANSGSPYAGPASRLQSYGSLATPQRSNSSSSLRHIPSGTPSATTPYSHPSQAQPRPSFTPQQQPTSTNALVANAAASTAAAAAAASGKVKVHRIPLGRGEAARRLRVNSIILVGWWIASRTTGYNYAAASVVQAAPSLDGPLHLAESCVYLLLFFNIAESIYRLQALSGLPEGPSSAGSSARRVGHSGSLFATPTKSSPKTRPSPSPSLSPALLGSPRGSYAGSPASPFRASAVGKTTPQTPSSAARSMSDVVRRTMFDSPAARSASVGSPLARSELSNSIGAGGYSPKHSALGTSVSINSQEAINRLLED